MKNLTKIFLTLSTAFIVWLYYLIFKIGLVAELWSTKPDILIFIVTLAVIGLVWGFIDERKTWKRLNNNK